MFLVTVLQNVVVQTLVAMKHSVRNVKFAVLQINDCAGKRLLSVQIVSSDGRIHRKSSRGKNVIVETKQHCPDLAIQISAVVLLCARNRV